MFTLNSRENIPNTTGSVVNKEEFQYLNLIRDIIENGSDKEDRTGVGTKSIFGPPNMKFNLRQGRFPLLTTKRVFWRGVVEELLWIISGSTDSKLLAQKNVTIWNENGSKAFLDKLGFIDREEGDLGPVYGFQWRHFGADYLDCKTDYSGQGIDQLKELIHLIKTDPNSRRMILCSWNAKDLSKMALPPCHVLCHFNVTNGELSCILYQRSCDLGLGVPFNIASYSLLTYMIAHVCKLNVGDFCYCLGDAHVYKNHIEPLKEQIERQPRQFPQLKIIRQVETINDFQFEDFQLENYEPYGPIKMKMAV